MSNGDSFNILLVDDEKIIHQSLGDYLSAAGHRVDDVYNGAEALKAIEAHEYDLCLLDVKMPKLDGLSALKKILEIRPSLPVVLISGHSSMELVIEALRAGATDFLIKPVKLIELDAVLEKSRNISRLLRQNKLSRETIRRIQHFYEVQRGVDNLVGESSAIRKVKAQIHQVVTAGCDTILVTGETGTGKEVVARQIHAVGASEESPFIAVSCPSIPGTLFESELFGHTKGSFTGATQDRGGFFELADGGTLFLDEIADIPIEGQTSLLRVLDTRTIRHVGSSKEIHAEVRIICATNASLEQLIEEKKFREDLYYRINVFSIHLSPLRERREDILPLAEHFLSRSVKDRRAECGGFSPRAKQMLLRYEYPGNARELRNIVERAAILCHSGMIQPEHLILPKPSAIKGSATLRQRHHSEEREIILKALEKTKWNRKQAAKILGIPYSTLRYRMKTYRID